MVRLWSRPATEIPTGHVDRRRNWHSLPGASSGSYDTVTWQAADQLWSRIVLVQAYLLHGRSNKRKDPTGRDAGPDSR